MLQHHLGEYEKWELIPSASFFESQIQVLGCENVKNAEVEAHINISKKTMACLILHIEDVFFLLYPGFHCFISRSFVVILSSQNL